MTAAPRLGHTVIEAEDVSKSFGERKVLDDVNLCSSAASAWASSGPNGVGKTTFLRVLLGELRPDAGKVVIGKNTRSPTTTSSAPRWTRSRRSTRRPARRDDWVELGDQQVALRDYLDDLLFPVPMQRMQVKALSGGERNRLLLARLFLEGANVLVLDEPTNDLDIVTLNVLERLLLYFDGSVLLVTHDRTSSTRWPRPSSPSRATASDPLRGQLRDVPAAEGAGGNVISLSPLGREGRVRGATDRPVTGRGPPGVTPQAPQALLQGFQRELGLKWRPRSRRAERRAKATSRPVSSGPPVHVPEGWLLGCCAAARARGGHGPGRATVRTMAGARVATLPAVGRAPSRSSA